MALAMFMSANAVPLLKVSDLKVHFPVKGGVFLRSVASCKAVDGVSLEVGKGETLGIIGESGCGKTTLGKAIVRLLKPTSGQILFDGKDLAQASAGTLRGMARDFQMIFQDPAESLNPRQTVADIVAEPFVVQKMGTAGERQKWVDELLDKVGLPQSAARKFPFEFSGGQRQRIGIARAIALKPRLIVCDEPVSALDVSVQSQVLNLLMDLQRDMGLSYLFISHNLAVVKHISDRLAIMYLGKIVEMGTAEELYRAPRHAYTKALISAIPVPDPAAERHRIRLTGDIPSPINPPPGCAFGHRVQAARYEQSVQREVKLQQVTPGHWVSDCPCCVDA
jgi:oligopeptide transport system ATP-binding protein